MLHRHAPRLPISENLIVAMLFLALMAYISVNAALAIPTAIPAVSLPENLILAAAPVNQPAEPNSAPAQPPTPTAEPTREPLPLIQVEWTLIENAPIVHALFVEDGILYAVQDTPGGKITWYQENGAWVSRLATENEAELVIDRDWSEFEDLFIEILGTKPEAGRAIIGFNSLTVGLTNDVTPWEWESRLFLNNNEEWLEIVSPAELGRLYGFVQIEDELFVAGWKQHETKTSLWQAQLKNLP